MITLRIDKKSYPARNGRTETRVFDSFSLDAATNEFICLFGPSGCGKTTLLNIAAGLDADFAGHIGLPDETRGIRVAYVFQEPRLLPWRNVEDNIRLAVIKEPALLENVSEVIRMVGLSGLENAFPAQLSGGQARRAALARAFVSEPELLLMDEPFASLDLPAAESLHQVLLDIWQAKPATILFVTHDLTEGLHLADRIVFLDGQPTMLRADKTIDIPRSSRRKSDVFQALVRECDELRRHAVTEQAS